MKTIDQPPANSATSPGSTAPAAESSGGSGVIVAEIDEEHLDYQPGLVHRIACKLIKPSPFQMRKVFDPDEMKKLADSIKADGQLQNAVVRPRRVESKIAGVKVGKQKIVGYELIAGERRWRAAKVAGVDLLCRVVECDDAKAVELAGMENFQRKQLNAIEEAHWFRAMIVKAGYTQDSLAKRLGLSQPHVSQRLALLDLPGLIQEQIITGVIPATWARELTPWVKLPQVLELVSKDFSRRSPETVVDLKRELEDAVDTLSQPLSGYVNFTDSKGQRHWGDVAIKPTARQLDELDVREVPSGRGKKEKRCFNLPLWIKLQVEGEQRRAERFESKGKAAAAAPTPAQRAEQQKKLKEQWEHRLVRWRSGFLQRLIVERLPKATDATLMRMLMHFAVEGHDQDSKDLSKPIHAAGGKPKIADYGRIQAWESLASVPDKNVRTVAIQTLQTWMQQDPEGWRSGLSHADVAGIAAELKIDLKRDFKLSKDFLELHTSAQLDDLLKEWNWTRIFDRPPATRADKIAGILDSARGGSVLCPKELLTLKAPRR